MKLVPWVNLCDLYVRDLARDLRFARKLGWAYRCCFSASKKKGTSKDGDLSLSLSLWFLPTTVVVRRSRIRLYRVIH